MQPQETTAAALSSEGPAAPTPLQGQHFNTLVTAKITFWGNLQAFISLVALTVVQQEPREQGWGSAPALSEEQNAL